jgi:alkylhydroperoxidase family enzyme
VAFVKTISPEDADGDLKIEYDKAVKRAGRVWRIVRMMSPNPAALRESMRFYRAVMHGPSPLTRAQREMLAVVVSKANDCHY